MEYGTTNVNSNRNVYETRSQRIKPSIIESRTLHTFCIYLLFFGASLLISGIIMTSVSYANQRAFEDPFFTDMKIFRTFGPILIGLGIFCLIPIGILCCVTKYSRNRYNENNLQPNFTDSIPPYQQSNLHNFCDELLNSSEYIPYTHNISNTSGYNPYHRDLPNTSRYNSHRYDLPIISGCNPYHYIIEEPPPPYDTIK